MLKRFLSRDGEDPVQAERRQVLGPPAPLETLDAAADDLVGLAAKVDALCGRGLRRRPARWLLLLALIASVALGAAACGAPEPEPAPAASSPAPASVTLTEPAAVDGTASPRSAGAGTEAEPSAPPTGGTAPAPTATDDVPFPGVSGWSNRRLAAQLIMCSVPTDAPSVGRRYARLGVGGIVLVGGGAPGDLGDQLAALQRAAPHGIRPFIASDEEGGLVQRLRDVIYPLPSPRLQGMGSASRTRTVAEDYGVHLRRLRVNLLLGPVADLEIPGRYMAGMDRCFSRDPKVVGDHVVAWVKGLREARVACAVKHWPGHGWARNTHVGAGRVPSLSVLRRADLLPFERAVAAGAPLVMVGHLASKGLTEGKEPASLSPTALAYLRGEVGEDVVIVSDSLSMGAASKAQGLSTPVAAVRSLAAGVDLALFVTGDLGDVVDAVTAAIADGELPRAQAEASARRILTLKRRLGAAPAGD